MVLFAKEASSDVEKKGGMSRFMGIGFHLLAKRNPVPTIYLR